MNKKTLISLSTTFVVVLVLGGFLFAWNSEGKEEKKVFENEMVKKADNGKEEFTKSFSDFSDNIDNFKGKIPTTSFSNSNASKKVSTTIKEKIQQGPTFAGKYAVVSYVCGNECQKSTIIDLNKGKIVVDGIRSVYNVSYRLNSRLFIVNPEKNIPENKSKIQSNVATSYYVISNGKLNFIGKNNVSLDNNSDKNCAQVVTGAENKATKELVYFPTPCDIPKFNWIKKR